MDKYTIAPPAGSTNNSVGASDRPWHEGHFESVKLNGGDLGEYLAESTGYGIVSGCEPSISGLTVTVGAGIVHLADGTRKEMSATNITLDAADSTNPRIDLVYINADGAVAKVTGTAAASPSAPSVPANGISVAQVSVAANATTGTLTDMRSIVSRWYNTGVVSVKDFGAVGDGVTDDTTAIQKACSIGNHVYFPAGTYKVTNIITITATEVIGNNAVINFSPDSWKLAVLNFVSNTSITVKGVSILANRMASIGINISPNFNPNKLEYISIENCKVTNTDNLSSQQESCGIYITRESDRIIVSGCAVDGVYRTSYNSGVIASSGITITNLVGTCDITNNEINNITYYTDKADADGVKVFSKNQTTSNASIAAVCISNNMITNCQGRFIKSQCYYLTCENNILKNTDIELSSFRCIDLQNGNGKICNNTVVIKNCTFVGNSPEAIQVNPQSYSLEGTTSIISNNSFYSDITYQYLFLLSLNDVKSTVIITSNNAVNFKVPVYITTSVTLTKDVDVMVNNNVINYSGGDTYFVVRADNAIDNSKIHVYSGGNKNNDTVSISALDITIPASITTSKDILDYISDNTFGVGTFVGRVIYLTHDTYTAIVRKESDIKSTVILFQNNVIQVLRNYSGSRYYYYYQATSM